MSNIQKRLTNPTSSRGGVLILAAFLMTVLIGVAAIAIDIGYLTTTRNELQNTADAAALAGAGFLGNAYVVLSPSQQASLQFTRSDIEDVIQAVSDINKASGTKVKIQASDIVISRWDGNTMSTENLVVTSGTYEPPDAVYVKARRDSTDDSQISTFFAGIFGIDTMSVTAEAVASLSGPGTMGEGELVTPFGISEEAFPNDCKDLIYFSPTTHSCAGWTNFHEEKISSSDMSEKIFNLIVSDDCKFCGPTTNEGLTQNGYDWLYDNFTPKNLIENNLDTDDATPAASAGVDFNFIGGETDQFNGHYLLDYDGNTGDAYGANGFVTVDKATDPAPIFALFDYFRYRDGDENVTVEEDIYAIDEVTVLYEEGHVFPKNDIWSTVVPVYKDDDKVNCKGVGTNVGGMTEIVGFAKVVVIQPNPPPAKDLNVIVDCNFSVVDARGGGGAFSNVRGSIPNLVK